MKAKLSVLTLFLFAFVQLAPVAAKGKQEAAREEAAPSAPAGELVVYTYDSFTNEWGPAPELSRLFKEKTGIDVTFIDAGDGAQIISRVILEKKSPRADLVIGFDNNKMNVVRSSDVFEPYMPANADAIIPEELRLDDDWLATPYDWGFFAMIYNAESFVPEPRSLAELANPVYQKKIILLDPRTSTPGAGFVAWTLAAFGEACGDFWRALKPNILTMAPSWSTGYGLFTSGEAPLVISYITSPAYHIENGEGERFRAARFDGGYPIQIEGAAIVRGAKNVEAAKRFLDFFITEEAQAVLPLTQWMYPVNAAVELPASYGPAPAIADALTVENEALAAAIDDVMSILAE